MKIRNMINGALLAAITLGSTIGATAQAQNAQWLPATNGDLFAGQLVRAADVAPLGPNANRNRELVEFQWALDQSQAIASLDAGSQNSSRQYWLDVSAAELDRGVAIHTTRPRALVRISPLNADPNIEITRDLLSIAQNGRALDLDTNLDTFASAEQLRATGAPFAEGTIAFRLNARVAAGTLNLQLANGYKGDTPFVVHVFEPDSAVVAAISTAQSTYLQGQSLSVNLAIAQANGTVKGYLSSPDGKTTLPLSFNGQGGQFTAQVELPAAHGRGLWEVHTYFDGVSEGLRVLRDVKTALQVSAPTARFTGSVDSLAGQKTRGVAISIGVEVAAAGRYQLSGVLYGTDGKGRLVPAGMAQSAQWLEAGNQQLPLSFKADSLSAAGFGAPYEIRDLRLLDQSRMGVLQRQARAVSIVQ